MTIGNQRALSIDIGLVCVILWERQFVVLLRSAWEKYKCLTVQILVSVRSEMVSCTELETRRHGFTIFK